MKKINLFFVVLSLFILTGIVYSLYTGTPILNSFFELFGEKGDFTGLWVMIVASSLTVIFITYKFLKK